VTRVLVTDHTWPSVTPEAEVLARVGASLVVAPSDDEETLAALASDADAILTCFAQVTRRVIEAGKRLQVIGRYGIGVDNIDVATATRLGIPVTNVPAYCVDEVAEHVFALLLCAARKVHLYDRAVREGDWSLARGAPIHRVAGRTLGIVGFGRIGSAVARKAEGLGLEVVVHDPAASDLGLHELAERADFVTIHAPLTAETEGMIGRDFLRRMKPTAVLVNAARGAIVDQDALLQALREHWIAGAALDVFVPERLPPGHPLLDQPNLIATPHVAFYSEESVHDLEVLAAENVASILSGRRPAALVNPEVLDLPRWAHLR
jgi:D-3-phosphoglycerate dehydrogenase / 2-oxoglutarate reductase